MNEKLSDKMESFSKGPMADYGYFKKLIEEAKLLEEKTEKWDELCDPLTIIATTGDFGAAIQRHLKLQEAERRLRAASDWIKIKRTSKDFAFTVGFISSDELDELEAIIGDSKLIKWNAVNFLKSLNKEQLQELLQAVSLIVDPLGQELIKKAMAELLLDKIDELQNLLPPVSPVPELIPELISLTKAMGLEPPYEERTTFRYFTVWHQRANRSVIFVHEMGLIWHMKVCMEGMDLGESPTVLTFRQGEQVLPSHVELRGCEAHETPYAYFWYPKGDAWAIIPYPRQNYVELRNLFEEIPWSEGAPIEKRP